MYVGDDVTDEDVFRLDQPGRLFTVRVGRSRTSAARYYLRQQQEIDALLEHLVALRVDAAAARRAARRSAVVTRRPDTRIRVRGSLEFLQCPVADQPRPRAPVAPDGEGDRRDRPAAPGAALPGPLPGRHRRAAGRALHVDPGTLSASVRRLEARGLVERRRDPIDTRRVTLGLTRQGRALDVPRPGTVEAAADALLARRRAAGSGRHRPRPRSLRRAPAGRVPRRGWRATFGDDLPPSPRSCLPWPSFGGLPLPAGPKVSEC